MQKRFPESIPALRELPALNAGMLVVAAIFAGLCNVGVFVLLLAARFTLDAMREAKDGMPKVRELRAAIRMNIPDGMLLVLGLALAVYGGSLSSLIAGHGPDRGLWALFFGLSLFLGKFIILLRFFLRGHSADPSRVRHDALSSQEIVILMIILVSILLLAVSPLLLSGGLPTVLEILRRQLIPWRF